MNIDKKNGAVCYNDETHTYWNENDNEKYISVTTLIHRFTNEFDELFWSQYKALERLIPADAWKIKKKSILNTHKIDKELLNLYNITELEFNKAQQDILDEWDKTNRESCERGTKIHAQLENSMYKMGANVTLKKFGVGGKFVCEKGKTELDLENGVYPEYLISRESPDGVLRIAGQIDLLVKQGNEITIMDWKGLPVDTPIATETGFKTMGELQVGDKVFDKDGNLCSVNVKSSIHHNPCYKIEFDNAESIIADCDHRWLISFAGNKTKKFPDGWRDKVMTTEELAAYLENLGEDRQPYLIPKIRNCKPINCPEQILPIDPYVLGCWLGDGSKSCGVIANETNNIWGEIKSRGYELSDNLSQEDHCEMRTVYGLRSGLRQLNLLNNKHIPDIYLRASYKQRLDLLRGLMDTDGYYHPKRKRFVMDTNQEWQMRDLCKLLGTLGIKASVFDIITKLEGKEYPGWQVNFSTLDLNPFLSRNQEIEFPVKDKCSFRVIKSVTPCETVPTQCIEVDSPSHTYLAGYNMIVTHNTNKEIKQKSFFDSKAKKTVNMKYPLNNIQDCNYYHYTLQLSTYAWMLQKLNPDFVIKDLIMVHFDHNDNQTVYHLDYLKDDVEKMLKFYKKELLHKKQLSKYQRIEY